MIKESIFEDRGAVGYRSHAFLPATRFEDPLPIQWVDATREEVYAELAATWNNPRYQEDDSSLTKRLQYWTDTLYDELMRRETERFKQNSWSIPRPRVRIMEHPSRNAFVSSRTVCYRSSLALAKNRNMAKLGPGATLRINKKGAIGLYPSENFLCLDGSRSSAGSLAGDGEIPPEWIKSYLDLNIGVSGCSYAVEQGTLVFGPDCTVGGASSDRWIGQIALESVTPWITVTTGMLSQIRNEDELVFILTHELAHYFYAHGALVKENFRYFYRQTEENLRLPRPEPDPSLGDLAKALRKLPSYRTQPIEGQKYHSEMFSYFRTAFKHLITPTCEKSDSPCFEPCKEIMELGANPVFQKNLYAFPQAPLGGEALDQYHRYEKAYARCASNLTIASAADPIKALVDVAAVKRIYWKAKLEPLREDMTLSDAMDEMNQELQIQEASQNQLLQQALDQKLGHYTTEEEADMLALQWVALLGLNPGAAREFWLEFLRLSPEQSSPYNFAYERCRALYEELPRWTEGGKPVSVPIGNFAQSHHSKCFRLYKIDLRLGAVRYFEGKDRLDGALNIGGLWQNLAPPNPTQAPDISSSEDL